MKKKRLKQWLAATMAATMVVTSAIASPVDVQAANKTVTVSTQKEFDKAVKQSGVKTIIVKSKTLKKLAVKSGNHSKITLKVDAPKVKIENKAKFAKVKIVDASSVTESKSGNTYVISDKKLSVTAKKSIKSITYSASKGTLTLSGAAKVSSVKVTKNDGSVIKNNTKNAITVVLADGTKKTVKSGKKLTAKTSTPVKETEKLSYAGYELKWQDDFNGDQLNRNDWNVELHEAGWVNNELQEYVDSSENIQVKDGNLYLKPVQKKNSDGTYSYTSGRVNTQGKHDFKYGLFEARVKVPKGKGYLPAFWMMPTNENVYGQWPKCGEIDCMEVMGQENNKVYGTIHFGDPHSERQNTYTLSEGNFTDEYHTFSCEWEPGKIKWYVDGVLYHTADDWYTTTTGQGTITYPAPFDQPFYMILNLAVGGSWVGYPDDKTTFDDQAFVIDYVKAYQKDSYNENVKKPVKNVELRKPDAKGNYINNGDFAKAEGLNDGKNWEFMTAQGGDATATIKNNEINIATKNEGTVDYSVQLVQANVPFEKGATYEVSFDASASADRMVKTAVKAPDFNYMEYMPSKTVELTTAKKHYSYEFQMKSDSDPNGRLEFNMGAAGSTADVVISNVAVKKIKEADKNAKEVKSVLADGNYVYNGGFQEGDNRLGYWTVKNNAGAEVYVTNKNLVRELKAVVPSSVKSLSDVIVEQDELALSTEKQYVLSFDAYADEEKEIEVKAAGQTFKANVTKEKKNFKYEFETPKALSDKSIQLLLGAKGTTYIDNVRIAENGMIINGDFSAGMTGFVEWNHDAAKVDSYCVDTLKEKSAFCIDISDTGSEAWHIQLKQEGVKLEKDQTYKLTFDAKSTLDRSINAKFQRNGNLHNDDWTVYGEKNVSLTKDFQTYELTFKMDKDTDAESVLDFEFGAVGGKLTKKHTVTLDNIKLEKAEKSDEEEKKVETTPSYSFPGAGTTTKDTFETPVSTDTAKNVEKWNNGGLEHATVQSEGEKVVATLIGTNAKLACNVPIEATDYQKVDTTVTLEADGPMTVTLGLKAASEVATKAGTYALRARVMDIKNKSKFIGGTKTVVFTEQGTQKVTLRSDLANTPGKVVVAMEVECEESGRKLGISKVSVKNANKVANSGWEFYADPKLGGAATLETSEVKNEHVINVTRVGDQKDYSVVYKKTGLSVREKTKYKVSFEARSTADRVIKAAFMDPEDEYYYLGGGDYELTNEYKSFSFVMPGENPIKTTSTGMIQFSLGYIEGKKCDPSIVSIKNIVFEELLSEVEDDGKNPSDDGKDPSSPEQPKPEVEKPVMGIELLKNGDFSKGETNWTKTATGQATAEWSFDGGKAKVDITSLGSAEPDTQAWHVNLKQTGLTLVKGCKYEVKATITSNVDRTALFACMDNGNAKWYVVDDNKIELQANQPKEVTFKVSVGDNATDTNAYIGFNLGKIVEETPDKSTITIDDVSLKCIEGGKVEETPEQPETGGDDQGTEVSEITLESDAGLLNGKKVENGQNVSIRKFDGYFEVTAQNKAVQQNWGMDYSQSQLKCLVDLENGKTYKLTYDVKADFTQDIRFGVQQFANPWGSYSDQYVCNVVKDADWQTIEQNITVSGNNISNSGLFFNLAVEGHSGQKICFRKLKLEKINGNDPILPKIDKSTWGGINESQTTIDGDYAITYDISSTGDNEDSVKLMKSGLALTEGKYKVSAKVKVSRDYSVRLCLRDTGNEWAGLYIDTNESEQGKLVKADNISHIIEGEITIDGSTHKASNTWELAVFMGNIKNANNTATNDSRVTVELSEISIEKQQ